MKHEGIKKMIEASQGLYKSLRKLDVSVTSKYMTKFLGIHIETNKVSGRIILDNVKWYLKQIKLERLQ